MKSFRKLLLGALSTGLVSLGMVSISHAIIVQATDGVTTQQCQDGAGCDSNPLAGFVNATFLFNGNTEVTTAVGQTFPFLGTAGQPHIDLLGSVTTGQGSNGGTFVISASQDFYTGPSSPVGFSHLVGGTTNGTAAFAAYADDANGLFVQQQTIANLGIFPTGAFSGANFGSANVSNPYSLTLVATIVHDGAGQVTTFNHELQAVPEPGTMMLMGSGLLGLGLWRRFKK